MVMVSRRSFLKLTGLAAMAAGAGYTTGKVTGIGRTSRFTVHGFIPSDEGIVKMIVAAFRQRVGTHASLTIDAEGRMKGILARAAESAGAGGFAIGGAMACRSRILPGPVDADIVIGDEKIALYSPERDFPDAFRAIRNELKGRKADCMLTVSTESRGLLASLFGGARKEVVIENETGTTDRIPLDGRSAVIWIDGPLGKTGLEISNGAARVRTSVCRHGLCKHAHASEPGDMIACAPNRVLVRVEPA
jgi:hypothetical protein